MAHGRDHLAQAESNLPLSNAAIEIENATEKPTYPMYNIGGWMINPGSCNNGFKSFPSSGIGNKRSNGLEVISIKRRNPTLTKPITPSTRATMSLGKLRLKIVTAKVHALSINTQSNNEPSCAPQTAEIFILKR